METPKPLVDEENQAKPLPAGVIEIGSTSIRMVLAELFPDGRMRTLENLSRVVSLGEDTFSLRSLSR